MLDVITNTAGVLTPENNDYATITMAVGVASSGTVAVHDGINTFPAGSIAWICCSRHEWLVGKLTSKYTFNFNL